MSILVVDVGTSGVRAAIVRPDATVTDVHYREVLPDLAAARASSSSTPRRWPSAALEAARASLAAGGPVDAVGIANQRASTIVWDRATGEPVGPGIGWQDLRTIGVCLVLREQGFHLAPNVSATKAQYLLDLADPDRTRDLCVGTVDTWIAWHLTRRHRPRDRPDQRRAHRAAHRPTAARGHDELLDALRIPEASLPEVIESSGQGPDGDRARRRAPDLRHRRRPAGVAGRPGLRATGSGQDHLRHRRHARPLPRRRPTVASSRGARAARSRSSPGAAAADTTWGVEAVMLSAGTNIEWLRDDLGLVPDAASTHDIASAVHRHRGRRVRARAAWGSARRSGTTARGARCSASPAAPTGRGSCGPCSKASPTAAPTSSRRPRPTAASPIPSLRVDGGMSANPTFVQALADASGRPVEISPVLEATTLGAGLLAGLAVGHLGGRGRRGRHLVAGAGRRAGPAARPATGGPTPAAGPAPGSPSSPRLDF